MRIPQFTSQVTEADIPNVQISGGVMPGQAVDMVGNRVDGFVNLANTVANKYKEYQDDSDKARVALTIAETQNGVNDYLYNSKTGLLNIKGEAALKRESGKSLIDEANTWLNDFTTEKIEGLSNSNQRNLFNQNLITVRGQLNRIASQHLFTESQKFQKTAFEAEIDANSSSVNLNYSDLETTNQSLTKINSASQNYGKSQGWNQQQIDLFVKEQQDKALLGAINLMQTNGDPSAIPSYFKQYKDHMSPQTQAKVGKLIQDNNADVFMTEIIKYKEDPEELDNYIVALQDPNSKFSQSVGARNIPTLLGRAIGYRDAYDRNLVAETKRKDEDGKKALGDFRKDIESGIPFSAQRLSELSSKVEGTASQSGFEKLNRSLPIFQLLYSMPADARESFVNSYESDAKTKKSDNPQDVKFVTDQMRAIHTGLLDKEKNDPALAYSIKTGKPLTQAPTTLIIQGDSKALNIVSSNIQKMVATNQASGSTTGSINPLSKQQQEEMKSFWKSAPPNQRLHLVSNLQKAAQGNPNASREMIQSITGTSNNTFRWAAALNNRGLKDIANQMAVGQDLIDKGDVKVDEALLTQKTTEYLKGITAPGKPDFNIYKDAVRANYAYLLQKSEKIPNKTEKSTSKKLDEDLINLALLNTTGGKFTNGSFRRETSVLRPHTVGEASFRQQLEQFNSRNARTYGGSDREFFLDLPLEQDTKNPYQYYFKNGSGYVMDSTDPKRKTRLTFTVR
ncbi:TPA: hypothetical protein ACGCCX_002189 [Acinetobacter nosocomialis]|uniref:Uncharacterized protein n=1 Tax=Acinetobacter nosocomialis NIPH 386 TaxID=1217985 RepID=A0AAV3IN49_ACINO|nr:MULTISPECIES: hypothetical protein [Acinetobacter]EKU51985.1 hypothetical protein ACINWC487_2718 [Acinetobacter nosocomialis]ENV41098.1 hypothetical protein F958_01801 [Acinetobacter nosocomialis NIPH 386]EXI12823.1 hypothetical protein J604_1289 [Acinetobacter sp. 694762]MBU3139424.1 hypothetical protein [Acinetobacter nosocomialis]MCU4575436.1 hypothetical protein [Acinetobacter nosocomialis]